MLKIGRTRFSTKRRERIKATQLSLGQIREAVKSRLTPASQDARRVTWERMQDIFFRHMKGE